MRKLTLKQLKCYETEDWGSDECRLEVYTDGVLQAPPLRRNLDDGDKWNLNREYLFRDVAEVKLWDEDTPDPDDLLGVNQIPPTFVDHASVSFTRDDARYKLWYGVAEAPESAVDDVEAAIRRFEDSLQAGRWPYIPKGQLIGDMRQSVIDPFQIDQGRTPFCGPAAIVFELVSKHPRKYVEVCQELYETVRFNGRTKTVEPSAKLVESRVRSGISLADWMLMGTLRDTENAIFPVVEGSGDLAAGVTTPHELKGWTFELLGYDNVEYESLYFYGEFEAMRRAARIRNRGGVAFPMIHSAMVKEEEPVVGYPNHWISFLGNLQIDEGVWHVWDSGNIKFDCYTWGGRRTVDVGEGTFEDCMWGLVTGE